MISLYTEGTVICKLKNKFFEIFSQESKPTKEHLFELALSVLGLNGFQSVKCNYDHFIEPISEHRLKSFYYCLNEGADHEEEWMKAIIKSAVSIIDDEYPEQPVILSIDDTMVEKEGKKFENASKLFDHAAHNGSNYLNGHCFVSLLMSIPYIECETKKYISFPVGYRMWTKEKTKLEMSAELVKNVMEVIGEEHNVVLCCDSWYPKGEVKDLAFQYKNLNLICNARSDTAMYELPPERTGKKGRPAVRGEKLSFDNFEFTEIDGTDFCVAFKPVRTMLFGNNTIYAIATKPKNSDSKRLFFSTVSPEELGFDIGFSPNATASAYAEADSRLIILTAYAIRWNIEVSYYEQKTFWSLGKYMLRSRKGIENLINLITVVYDMVILLPCLFDDFSFLKGLSPQQARFVLGSKIQQQIFLSTFDDRLPVEKNKNGVRKIIISQILELIKAS